MDLILSAHKKGELYEKIKSQIKPFDLIVFKGEDFVSRTIAYFEKRGKKNTKNGDFSHIGMIVTRDVLDEPMMEHNKLYILESTVSGRFGYNVKNIHNSSFLGVQIRDFDNLIQHYDISDHTAIAWCHLINNPFQNPEIKQNFNAIYQEVNHRYYDANCFDLFSAIYPSMRTIRWFVDKIFRTGNFFFCSELVAYVYQKLNIYPNTIEPKNMTPDDIIHPEEDSDPIPKVIDKITYITTEQHIAPNEDPKIV